MLKITWLGQAGLLIENERIKIMIDPYLTNNVAQVNPDNYRRVSVDPSLFEIHPDVLVFTHNHLDHYDPETAEKFLAYDQKMLVLSPASVWSEVRKFGRGHNYVQFNRHTIWTEYGITFIAVKAEHSDPSPIGVVIDDGGAKYYITGDTLYNSEIFGDIPSDIFALFLPINGVGNNMNMTDATRFAANINAQRVIPLHFGMFDDINPAEFACKNKIIPTIYKEIVL